MVCNSHNCSVLYVVVFNIFKNNNKLVMFFCHRCIYLGQCRTVLRAVPQAGYGTGIVMLTAITQPVIGTEGTAATAHIVDHKESIMVPTHSQQVFTMLYRTFG